MRLIYHLLLSVLICAGCSKDPPHNTTPVIPNGGNSGNPGIGSAGYIDPVFLPYVNSFKAEMLSRGVGVDITSLSVTFVDEITIGGGEQFCAYAFNIFGGGNPRIEIKQNAQCWNDRTNKERENLMYHELGHALLGQVHFSQLLPNGMPVSLMCSLVCNNYRVYNKYQSQQRSYYLDQLVNPSTPPPTWSQEKFFSEVITTEDFDLPLEHWEYTIENDPRGTIPYQFYLEDEHTTSPPYSLGIYSNGTATEEGYGYWYKDFEVYNFEYCANIVLKANIITNDLSSGYVALVVDFIEYDGANNPEPFGRYSNVIQDNTNGLQIYADFETTSLCLTSEVEAIRVLFYFKTQVEASVYLDDLRIELFE
ncbi:hypothetical protein [Constantimarinum furrinae]|uniref:Uncharacterized protein n=1 Tax=Constantimarinum furrinae TaxID=2562285 RepID=A0A7G8PUV7_9FLAO|nr:hypothetical protein [Constantimarinum furrinae]QNJ98123.1 hypothetical protein ALE3EI_1565 [Constantimarinum furrinae]